MGMYNKNRTMLPHDVLPSSIFIVLSDLESGARMNKFIGNEEYRENVVKKFDVLLAACEAERISTLLMCDIGCGVFQNDPTVVGECFGEALLKTTIPTEIVLTGHPKFKEAVQQKVNAHPQR